MIKVKQLSMQVKTSALLISNTAGGEGLTFSWKTEKMATTINKWSMQVKTSNIMDIKYCFRIMVSTMHYEGKLCSMFLHICCIYEIIQNNQHERIRKCTLEKGSVLLALQSTGKSCFTGLVLYCCCKFCKFSLVLFPVEQHHHPISLQLKHNIFELYFVQHWTWHSKIFHYSVKCSFT